MSFLRANGNLLRAGLQFLRAIPRSSDVVTVTDDFEAYTTGALAGQGNWVLLITGGYSFAVTDTAGDRRASLVSGAVGNKRTETIADDQYAQATIDVTGPSYVGVGVRISGTTSASGFFYYGGADDSYVVYRVNGSETSLAGGNYAFSTNDIIKIQISGTELRVYRNGSLDTRHNGTGIYDVSSIITANSMLESGTVGIWGNYTDMSIDDFMAGDL